MNPQKTIKKRALSEYRNFLIKQIKSYDLDRLSLDDEAKFRLGALDDFTTFQAEEWILSFPVLCEKKALFDFFSVNEIEISNPAKATHASLFKQARDYFKDDNTLDGVDQETFVKGLYEGATLENIRACALFYGLNLPRRIKKAELVQIIHERSNQTLSLEQLNKMSVLDLEILSKERHFNISIELKKIEMIHYLMDHLKKTFNVDPSSHSPIQKEAKSNVILDLTTQEFLSRKTNVVSIKYVILSLLILSGLIGLIVFYL